MFVPFFERRRRAQGGKKGIIATAKRDAPPAAAQRAGMRAQRLLSRARAPNTMMCRARDGEKDQQRRRKKKSIACHLRARARGTETAAVPTWNRHSVIPNRTLKVS